MRYAWANTLLLVLVTAAGVTGLLGLVSGSADRAFWNDLHGMAGWAIIGVLGWKTIIVVRSLRRRARGPAARQWSLVLSGLLLLVLGLGFWWSQLGRFDPLGTTGMNLHIWLGAFVVPIMAWHAWRYTIRFRTGYSADRRAALRLIGAAAAGAAAFAVVETATRALGLPGASRRFTGSYERGSFTGNGFPRTSWLNDDPEPLDASDWRLTLSGVVRRPLEIAMQDGLPLVRRDGTTVPIRSDTSMVETLDCTGGWHTTQIWIGLSVADLLEHAGLDDSARSVTFTSVTGYYRRASLDEARRCLLAIRVGDEPLSHGHGAPMRLVWPERRGYEWVKWLTSITVNTDSRWLQPPLPLR